MANIEVTDLTPDTTPQSTELLLGYDPGAPTTPKLYAIGDVTATTWRGTYSGATAYIRGDLVAYSGATYRASQATTGNLPTNTTYWEVVAAKGDTGATGAQGPAGTNGTNGTNGAPGADGADGADGEDGASAYEIAVANGFVGNEAAWLASLVGPEGPQGEQGPAGADGADGAPGADGADGATGATGATGPAGPTAVSADAGNAATLGTDNLLYVAGIAATTHAATSKATPVDADELPLADSAASFGLKRLTWANLKATAKTYFDTLYATVGHNHSGTYEPVLGNPGTDGYVLSSTTGGTRSWTAPGSGGGAPTDAKYLTTASNGTLSAEVVIPGLAGSLLVKGRNGGGTLDRDFDSTDTTLPTWTPSNPATQDIDSTAPSHLYLRQTDGTSRTGSFAWAPAGAFDIVASIALGRETSTISHCGLILTNSDQSQRILLDFGFASTGTITAYTYAGGTYTARSGNLAVYTNHMYLRLTRDGSNTIGWWFSYTPAPGSWHPLATFAFTTTIAYAGVAFGNGATGATISTASVDFIRATT